MITGALDERSIRLRGRIENAADFGQLVVAQRGGQLIRLADVANVSDGSAEQRSLALFNGVARHRHRHHEVEGLEHDPRERRDQGYGGGDSEDAAAGREARHRA